MERAMRSVAWAASVAAAVLAATGANAAIVNGSFETPTVTVGSFTDFVVGTSTLTGWSVIGPGGLNVSIVSGSFSQNGVTFN
jgi:hypothetical protein